MKNLIKNFSADNSDIQMYVSNKEVHLLRYYEPEPGIFIAESKNVIEIALRQGYTPCSAVILERMKDDLFLQKLGDIPIYIVDESLVKEVFGYVLTGGISCAMRRKPNLPVSEIFNKSKRLLVLEDVENPTNIGSLFRSAAALGIDAVILSPACTDPLYRRALRVSVGNALQIPYSFMCQSEKQWQESAVNILKNEHFTTVALALRNDNIYINDPGLKAADKLAIIMGNEGNGLCQNTIAAADFVAKIPMADGVDSLNVSVAAALAMWELGNKK